MVSLGYTYIKYDIEKKSMSKVLGKTRFAFTGIISVTCQIHTEKSTIGCTVPCTGRH